MKFNVIAVAALAAAVSAEQDLAQASSSSVAPTGSAKNSTAPASYSSAPSSSAVHSHHASSSVAHVHSAAGYSSSSTPSSTSCSTKAATSTPCTSAKGKPTTLKQTPKPSVACTKNNGTAAHPCPSKPHHPVMAYNGTKPSQVPAVVPSVGAAADNVVPAAAGLGLVAAIGFVLL